MPSLTHSWDALSAATREFYCQGIEILEDSGIPFLVGGAYALERYTGIVRQTKDLDIFLRPHDCPAALEVFAERGYRAELTFPHWLGKVYQDDEVIDLIFSSGNAVAEVDDAWFEHAVSDVALQKPVQLCPAEEMIWSKAFVQERERYDGADIAHLLRARAHCLDWRRLCARFGPHWRILLSHLILFGYVYPAEQAAIPAEVLKDLFARFQQASAAPAPAEPVCQGTLLSREQYLIDIRSWGYADPRLPPFGKMTAQEIGHWTNSIGVDNPSPPYERQEEMK